MSKRTRIITVIAAVLIVIVGVVIFAVTRPSPPRRAAPLTCLPDPAAQIDAMPAGSTFDGTGHCYVTHGILIDHRVNIEGGTYRDPDNSVPPQTTHGAVPLAPIIKVVHTGGLTIENVHLIGSDTDGHYDSALVNNAGIVVLDSHYIHLNNIVTRDTFGDGLELWTQGPTFGGSGDDHITVQGFDAYNSGRVGFTIAWAQNVTMDDVHGKSFSFETDTGPEVAPGNVTITNCSMQTLLNIPNAIDGPITFDHCTGSAQITVSDGQANPAHGIPASPVGSDPITISNSQIATPANSYGYPPSGIFDRGANLFLLGDSFTRIPNPQTTGPAYWAIGGAALTTTGSTFVDPPGQHDGRSTVTP